jgi:hypothetical protein
MTKRMSGVWCKLFLRHNYMFIFNNFLYIKWQENIKGISCKSMEVNIMLHIFFWCRMWKLCWKNYFIYHITNTKLFWYFSKNLFHPSAAVTLCQILDRRIRVTAHLNKLMKVKFILRLWIISAFINIIQNWLWTLQVNIVFTCIAAAQVMYRKRNRAISK